MLVILSHCIYREREREKREKEQVDSRIEDKPRRVSEADFLTLADDGDIEHGDVMAAFLRWDSNGSFGVNCKDGRCRSGSEMFVPLGFSHVQHQYLYFTFATTKLSKEMASLTRMSC